ncbi:hypothetical protein LEMLEM_LOCUS220 [Lemmus lemmus]
MPAFSCSHWSMNSHSNPGLTGPYLQNAQRPVTELAGARRLAGGLCLQACTTTSDSCSAGDITWNLLHVSVASSPAAAEGIHHNYGTLVGPRSASEASPFLLSTSEGQLTTAQVLPS